LNRPRFPRTGRRAGPSGGKPGSGYAEELRKDLRRAMGLEVFEPGKWGGRWVEHVKPEDYTPRQRELFLDTQYTKPVDFHSWRRAFNQALADAGLNAQQAAALAGHASLEAHAKYLKNSAKSAQLPDAAVPKLDDYRPRPRTNLKLASGDRYGKLVEAPGVEGRREGSGFDGLRGVSDENAGDSTRLAMSGEKASEGSVGFTEVGCSIEGTEGEEGIAGAGAGAIDLVRVAVAPLGGDQSNGDAGRSTPPEIETLLPARLRALGHVLAAVEAFLEAGDVKGALSLIRAFPRSASSR
jgi:hypothetical protein